MNWINKIPRTKSKSKNQRCTELEISDKLLDKLSKISSPPAEWFDGEDEKPF